MPLAAQAESGPEGEAERLRRRRKLEISQEAEPEIQPKAQADGAIEGETGRLDERRKSNAGQDSRIGSSFGSAS